jgi:hypothetical protein
MPKKVKLHHLMSSERDGIVHRKRRNICMCRKMKRTYEANYVCITHTYIHTHVHTYIHTYTHTHTHIHTYIHTHKHTYIHTYIYTDLYTYIHTHTHKFVRTHARTQYHCCACGLTLPASGELYERATYIVIQKSKSRLQQPRQEDAWKTTLYYIILYCIILYYIILRYNKLKSTPSSRVLLEKLIVA